MKRERSERVGKNPSEMHRYTLKITVYLKSE